MCISLCITSVDKQNNIIINQMFAFILLFLQGTPFCCSLTFETVRKFYKNSDFTTLFTTLAFMLDRLDALKLLFFLGKCWVKTY